MEATTGQHIAKMILRFILHTTGESSIAVILCNTHKNKTSQAEWHAHTSS